MSYAIYKIVHLTAVMMVFISLGGLICRSALNRDDAVFGKMGGITSGVGLLIILISGFGLIAKLGVGFSGWIIGKLVIWTVLGGMIAVINRQPRLGTVLWWTIIVLGCTAATLATMKPF